MTAAATGDSDLVERSRRDDANAFRCLVERHQGLVFGVALASCGDPVLAEDIAQEAFAVAWRDLGRLRDKQRVGPWVAGIARNLAWNAVRGRARERTIVLDAPPVPTPEQQALDREDRQLLQGALEELPAAHREALVLYYIEGQSIARIATSLDIREDLVKQRLARGRNALREGVAARVASAIARARPRASVAGAVVATLAALGTRQATAAPSAAGGVFTIMSINKKLAIAAIATVAVAGSAWIAIGRGSAETAPPSIAAGRQPANSVLKPAIADASRPRVRRMADPSRRPQLIDQIRAAQQRRATESRQSGLGLPSGAAPRDSDSSAASEMEDWMGQAVQNLVPFFRDCYTQELEHNPKLTGTISIGFTIDSDPDLGAVITDSHVESAKTSAEVPEFIECVKQTMYALELDHAPAPSASAIATLTFDPDKEPDDQR